MVFHKKQLRFFNFLKRNFAAACDVAGADVGTCDGATAGVGDWLRLGLGLGLGL